VARPDGKGEGEKLRRLPPGRHGLSREFVSQNQQERLVAGTIAAVAERGFRETTVTDISAAAGVSRRTFYSYFQTKEECYTATFDLLEEHLFARLGEARAKGSSWTAQVRSRIAALLAFLGANPDLIRFALIAPPAAGGPVAERNRHLLERLVETLTEGAPEEGSHSTVGEVQREAMAGSISAVLATMAGRGDPIDDALPELLELVLSPFVGRRRAMTAAQRHQAR
jgi:AcrR family transcriptional regulator